MAASTASPWIEEGSQRVRFREEHGHLVKETNQPDRDLILSENHKERLAGQDGRFLGGWKVGSIPLNDLPFVQARHPELFNGDADLRRAALIKFSNDPLMEPYRIKKA